MAPTVQAPPPDLQQVVLQGIDAATKARFQALVANPDHTALDAFIRNPWPVLAEIGIRVDDEAHPLQNDLEANVSLSLREVEKARFLSLINNSAQREAFFQDPVPVLKGLGVRLDELARAAHNQPQPAAVPHGEGPKGHIETHWWGVQFVLNHEAVRLALKAEATSVSGLAVVIGAVAPLLPPPANGALAAGATVLAGALVLNAAAMYAADNGKGVYYVWPWPVLALLYPLPVTPIALMAMAVPWRIT